MKNKWMENEEQEGYTYTPPVGNGEMPQDDTLPNTDTIKQVVNYIHIIDRFGRKMKAADICIRRSIITGEEAVEVIITPN